MAELIVKDALIRELESVSFTEDAKKMKVGSDAEMDGFFKGYVEGMLYFVPTTTEAEIRALAIDEFAEKAIKIVYEANNRRRNPQPRDMVADIHYKLRDLAEQLKEE